jgi:hypothetical protein
MAESEYNVMRGSVSLLLFAGLGIAPGLAQEGIKPAPVLNIQRESIKEGRAAAHEKVEAEWAAALRKANFPQHFIALSALSGPTEVWFVVPMASFAAREKVSEVADKEPLRSIMAQLDSRDGELRAGSRQMWAVYREDISYHPEKFQPGKNRYVDIATFHVRTGRGEDFTQGAKTYMAAMSKANLDLCMLTYQVTAGAPSGTILFITPMDSLKFLDGEPERGKALMEAMGSEEFSRFMKSAGDVIASIEDTLFEIKPAMSLVPQNLIDANPAFWKPKPLPMPKPAPPAGTPAAADSKK